MAHGSTQECIRTFLRLPKLRVYSGVEAHQGQGGGQSGVAKRQCPWDGVWELSVKAAAGSLLVSGRLEPGGRKHWEARLQLEDGWERLLSPFMWSLGLEKKGLGCRCQAECRRVRPLVIQGSVCADSAVFTAECERKGRAGGHGDCQQHHQLQRPRHGLQDLHAGARGAEEAAW